MEHLPPMVAQEVDHHMSKKLADITHENINLCLSCWKTTITTMQWSTRQFGNQWIVFRVLFLVGITKGIMRCSFHIQYPRFKILINLCQIWWQILVR